MGGPVAGYHGHHIDGRRCAGVRVTGKELVLTNTGRLGFRTSGDPFAGKWPWTSQSVRAGPFRVHGENPDCGA